MRHISYSFIFVGDTNLCAGQSVRIVATPSSASTFQWINNNSILAGEIFRDIVTNSSGNYQIIVNGAGCIDTSRVVTVTVGTPPTVTLTLPDTVCQSDLAFTLSGGLPLGGNYSGIGVVNNQFDPALAGIGRQRVTYTFLMVGVQTQHSHLFMLNQLQVFSLHLFPMFVLHRHQLP